MPAFCAVFGCANRKNRNRDKSYYRLPKVIVHQGERTNELSQARRDKWLANIARSDLNPTTLRNLRVCSDHFVGKFMFWQMFLIVSPLFKCVLLASRYSAASLIVALIWVMMQITLACDAPRYLYLPHLLS